MSRLAILAAGGTGGHMFPAQALAEALLARGWRVALSSDARGLRYAGGFAEAVERREVGSASFSRGLGEAVRAPAVIGAGVLTARRWFLDAKPDCVIGFGGYPSFPALMAAALTRTPRLIHEQNAVLGRVNRHMASRVGLVACGNWPMQRAPNGARLEPVGNPVRAAALEAAKTPYAPPGAEIELLAFGGSQGASAFSRLIPEALALLPDDLRARIRLAQQVREGDAPEFPALAAIETAPFFLDMAARIARASLVISRAGASTVAELAVIGRPAILVPFPAAMDDHQSANAAALAQAGGALCEQERDLTPERLAGHLAALLAAPDRLTAMADAARSVGRPDAATRLADLVEEIADRRPTR